MRLIHIQVTKLNFQHCFVLVMARVVYVSWICFVITFFTCPARILSSISKIVWIKKKLKTWSRASDRNFLRVLEKPLLSKKWATAWRRRGLWSVLGFFMFSTTWRGFRARRIGSTASNSLLLRVLGIQWSAERTSPLRLRLRPPLLTTGIGKVGNGLIHFRNCGVLFRVCKTLKPPSPIALYVI